MQHNDFVIESDFVLAGDQPAACDALLDGLKQGKKSQVLLGVTGSGKTFTMANVIERYKKPTLILAPNKILAAQLYGEMKNFFPHNGVHYFVSYYDYYQPEAYVPSSDTYIEKESTINEQIDRMRHDATRALFERSDVIIIASVSCIYGIGDRETYGSMVIDIARGMTLPRSAFLKRLTELHYRRNDIELKRGTFRARGDSIEVFPSHYEDKIWRLSLFGDEVETIHECDPLDGSISATLNFIRIYANSHYVTPKPALKRAMTTIRQELQERLAQLEGNNQLLEAERLRQRTHYDLEMIAATGSCQGIENYSRHLTGRTRGAPPPTLFEYFPDESLLIVDESHVSVPQLGAMYKGDRSRKETLSAHGFRLPSCMDNRPLMFAEWDGMRPPTVFVSATPATWEREQATHTCVEQIVRPTGLMDPVCHVRAASTQVDDLIASLRQVIGKGQRALVTTLTKRMAEKLSEYVSECGINARYLHSDIDTLERIAIIRDLRLGVFDVLIGINLLREGLDIPECSLVAILDADKEGFLRSHTSLVQTIGRAARHQDGQAILYGDSVTPSMQHALDETARRREKQLAYNKKHNISPQSVQKSVSNIIDDMCERDYREIHLQVAKNEAQKDGESVEQAVARLTKEMIAAAEHLEFENAARLRDTIRELQENHLLRGGGTRSIAQKNLTKKNKKTRAAAS